MDLPWPWICTSAKIGSTSVARNVAVVIKVLPAVVLTFPDVIVHSALGTARNGHIPQRIRHRSGSGVACPALCLAMLPHTSWNALDTGRVECVLGRVRYRPHPRKELSRTVQSRFLFLSFSLFLSLPLPPSLSFSLSILLFVSLILHGISIYAKASRERKSNHKGMLARVPSTIFVWGGGCPSMAITRNLSRTYTNLATWQNNVCVVGCFLVCSGIFEFSKSGVWLVASPSSSPSQCSRRLMMAAAVRTVSIDVHEDVTILSVHETNIQSVGETTKYWPKWSRHCVGRRRPPGTGRNGPFIAPAGGDHKALARMVPSLRRQCIEGEALRSSDVIEDFVPTAAQ